MLLVRYHEQLSTDIYSRRYRESGIDATRRAERTSARHCEHPAIDIIGSDTNSRKQRPLIFIARDLGGIITKKVSSGIQGSLVW